MIAGYGNKNIEYIRGFLALLALNQGQVLCFTAKKIRNDP